MLPSIIIKHYKVLLKVTFQDDKAFTNAHMVSVYLVGYLTALVLLMLIVKCMLFRLAQDIKSHLSEIESQRLRRTQIYIFT